MPNSEFRNRQERANAPDTAFGLALALGLANGALEF